MESAKWRALYELIKVVVIDYCNRDESCIIAEYDNQDLHHGCMYRSHILGHARSKKFINEYRKYIPLTPDDLEGIMDKLHMEGVVCKIGYCGYALNRKYANPINPHLRLSIENEYIERIKKNDLMSYFDELNKIPLQQKLEHRILFNTLSGKAIISLIDHGIYTYYDLVTTRRFIACNQLDHTIQAHLHLLGLEFDMYEWTDKIKIEQDKKVLEIKDLLCKIHDKDVRFDLGINYFDKNIFVARENNYNFIKWFQAGVKRFGLEDYFTFKTLDLTSFAKKNSWRNTVNCICIQDDFPLDEIKVLLKLQGYI